MEQDKTELMQHYNLTECILQKKCSKNHIIEMGKCFSWKEVGDYLPRIERTDVNDIDCDGADQKDKRRRLLDLWEKRNGDGATYDVMITAMLKAGKKEEATKVCVLLQAG